MDLKTGIAPVGSSSINDRLVELVKKLRAVDDLQYNTRKGIYTKPETPSEMTENQLNTLADVVSELERLTTSIHELSDDILNTLF